MITYYANSFHTLAQWSHQVRLWLKTHPRSARVLATVLLIVYFTVVTHQTAQAESWLLPEGTSFTDTHGVPIEAYSSINVSSGDIWTPWKVIGNFIVQMLWVIQFYFTSTIIWLFNFLLTFEWVAWLSTPFNALATWLQGSLSGIGWIPFALTVTAAVAGAAILFGRTSSGIWEIVVALVISALAVGVLANPVATLTAADGFLQKAQEWGGTLAAAIVVDGEADPNSTIDTMSAAVSSQLVDVFIRTPHQVISFGMVLPADCQAPYSAMMSVVNPIEGFTGGAYQAFSSCLPDFSRWVSDNPGALNILFALVNGLGVLALLVFALVIAALLIVSVFFFLVAAVKAMILAYLGILPINREPLWRAVSDSFMGVLSLIVMTCCLSLYLKLTTWIMTASGGLPHNFRMTLLSILLVIMVVLVWKARKGTLNAGRMGAGVLSKLGLGMGNSTPKQSNALLKMSTLTNMASTAKSFMPRTAAPRPLPEAATPSAATASEKPVELRQIRTPKTSPAPAPAAAGNGGSYAGSSTISRSQKAIADGAAAANIARGAATAGAGGATAAAAAEVAKRLAARAKQKTSAKTAQGTDLGELKVMKVDEAPARIHINNDGSANVVRRPETVHDITSLPPTAPPAASIRSIERRRELESLLSRELVA